jgi:hypothetical protein
MGGGRSSTEATGVPSAFVKVGPFTPSVIVPQLAGALPGRGVIVQQVTRPRVKKNPPTARRTPTTATITCIVDGCRNLMFLRKFILFIQV